MSGSAAVIMDRVGKTFSNGRAAVVAVRDLSLSVTAGEVVGLVGPNGSGKTTALRIMAGLVAPTEGRVLVLGHDLARDAGAARRSLGLSLGSGRSFYWRLSAGHNLAFFARLAGVRGSAIRGEVHRLAAELDVERFLRTPARRLSRGVLERLSLARACLGEPAVLALDEPVASIDRRGRELVRALIVRRARAGRAVVVASHNPAELDCDRVLHM